MTEKQKRFCDEYLIDLNATQAAIRAGYSPKSAYSTGFKLIKTAAVKKYIDEQLELIHNERSADAQEVLEYLTSVLRGESSAEIVVVESVGEGCSEARRVKKAPDEKERLKAAELIGKRYGLFADKVSVDLEPVIIKNDLKE